MWDGAYGALPMWERRTAASASSCWPTILASEATHGGPSQRDSAGRPTLSALMRQWPTPAAIDSGSGRVNQSESPGAAVRPTLAWMARKAIWPTPQADNAHGGRNRKPDGTKYLSDGTYGPTLVDAVTRWPTPRAEKIDGEASKGYSPTLHQTVQQWPTPKAENANGAGLHGQGSPDLQTMVTLWPTPQTRDWKNGQASDATVQRNARPLSERVREAEKPAQQEGASLNADWVEMLQGFPPGWTIPSFPPGRENRRIPGNRRAPSHGA
ncbi:MAG TPA: hypothetical protein VMV29_12060 [Ktedonobacterales bacterium]|nr:hypothetical protein [Ktedonobacterales bacterium]